RQGDIGAAAVLHEQDQVVGGHVVSKHQVLEVHGLAVVHSGHGYSLVAAAVAGNMRQGLHSVQHVLGGAVVVVVDDLYLDAVPVELVVRGAALHVPDHLDGVFLIVGDTVVHIVLRLGGGDGHARALQVVLSGVL